MNKFWEGWDKFNITIIGTLVIVLSSCFLLAGLAIYSEVDNSGFCDDLGYDGYNEIKTIDGERWIECVKFSVENKSLTELNDWILFNRTDK